MQKKKKKDKKKKKKKKDDEEVRDLRRWPARTAKLTPRNRRTTRRSAARARS